MRKLVPVALSAALLGAPVGSARAGDACVTSGMPVAEGSMCANVPADAGAGARVAPSLVTASARAGSTSTGNNGAALQYDVPPRARAWVLGREYDTPGLSASPSPSPSPSGPPPAPDLCVTNLVGPAQGTACEDEARALPGSIQITNKGFYVGAFYVDRGADGAPLGDSSAESRYDHPPPGARVVVNGSTVYDRGM